MLVSLRDSAGQSRFLLWHQKALLVGQRGVLGPPVIGLTPVLRGCPAAKKLTTPPPPCFAPHPPA